MLDVRDVWLRRDGSTVLNGVTLTFGAEPVTVIIGPNGAGKTTLFDAIGGYISLNGGQIRLAGVRIDTLLPHQVAAHGLGRTFQEDRLAGKLSALDNVRVSLQKPSDEGAFASLLRAGRVDRANALQAEEWLRVIGLEGSASRRAEALSYGQRKSLSLACCLARGSQVVLLDEPFAGVSPTGIANLIEIINRFSAEGVRFVLIEHNLFAARLVATRIVVMDKGAVIADGPWEEISADRHVQAAYLSGDSQPTVSRDRRLPFTASKSGSLLLERVYAGYGHKEVVRDADLTLSPGELLGVFGPNGSGKSTLLKAAMGSSDLLSGRILLNGLPLPRKAPETRKGYGMCYAPQGAPVFPSLTVEQNLVIALHRKAGQVPLDRCWERFPSLQACSSQKAGTLSGGERHMLSLARCMLSSCEYLLLDEPTAGLSPRSASQILSEIRQSCDEEGVGVLLIEQNVSASMAVMDRGILMRGGKIVRPLLPNTPSSDVVASFFALDPEK